MPDKKKTIKIKKEMVSLSDAIDECGKHVYGSNWESDALFLLIEYERKYSFGNGKTKEYLARLKSDPAYGTRLGMATDIVEKINDYLWSGKLNAFFKISEKNIRSVPEHVWTKEINTGLYESGKIFDNQRHYKKRKAEGHTVYLVREEMEKLFLVPRTMLRSNAGRKHKFNYGQIMSIILEIYDNGEEPSQNQYAKRIQEVYQAVYNENDVPSVAVLKERILKEFLKPREAIKSYIQKNPITYKK